MTPNRLYLFYGCVLSLAALATLFAIRLYQPTLLDIDVKWLVVAALPILIALIVGRFINGFKGFGMELSVAAEAEKPIINSQSITLSSQPVAAIEKAGLEILRSLPRSEKQQFNILTFVARRTGYYDYDVVKEYLKELSNLKFLEVVDGERHFIALVPLPANMHDQRRELFINTFLLTINIGDFSTFSFPYSKAFVFQSESVISTLRKLRKSANSFIAVVNDERKLVGYTTESNLEKTLADAVLADLDRKGL